MIKWGDRISPNYLVRGHISPEWASDESKTLLLIILNLPVKLTFISLLGYKNDLTLDFVEVNWVEEGPMAPRRQLLLLRSPYTQGQFMYPINL